MPEMVEDINHFLFFERQSFLSFLSCTVKSKAEFKLLTLHKRTKKLDVYLYKDPK